MKPETEQMVAGRIVAVEKPFRPVGEPGERPDRPRALRERRWRPVDPPGLQDRRFVVELESAREARRPERGSGEYEQRGLSASSERHGGDDTTGGLQRAVAARCAAAAVALAAAGATAFAAQVPCGEEIPSSAPTAASKARAEAGYPVQDTPVEGPCTCDEIEHYLKRDVERKESCYRQAYDVGRAQPMGNQDALNGFVETCMGWRAGSAESHGKSGAASPAEKRSAYDKCRRARCQWICDVAVECVHEKYHDYFKERSGSLEDLLLALDVIGSWSASPAIQDLALDEIGAHAAEAQFLRDRLEEARRKGKCADVTGSVQKPEADFRFLQAFGRARRYVDSLGGER
jgi:hypothetical protein